MAAAGVEEDASGSYYAVLNVSRDATTDEIKRAYRQLASVFHPDKHASDELRAQAQEAFARLQEAYEVLSDPAKRDIYDAYGREGLHAGFEVGTKLQSTEERRAQWAAFLEEQERKRQDALSNHRGHYMCKLDATALAHGAPQLPAARAVVASNAIDVPLDGSGGADLGILTIQGQALLRTHPRIVGTMLGSGSILAGYQRRFGDANTLDGSVQMGLNSLATLTSTRQVDHYTQAALAATFNWEQGLGLQVISTRQLWKATTGEFRWIVGPAPGGVSLAVAHRGRGWGGTGRLEFSGGAASAQLRLTWEASESTQLRGVARLSLMGPDLEIGAEHKFNSITTGYVGTQVGMRSGVLLRLRCRRSKQTFEFPVLLTTDAREWQLFAASAILPPLVSLAVHRLVVKPFVNWRRAATARAARREHSEALRDAHGKAAREAALLFPVARRRAAAEAAAGGLIVLEAIYGDLHAWREAAAAGAGAGGSAGCSHPTPQPLWPAGDEAGTAPDGEQQQQDAVAAATAAAAAAAAGSQQQQQEAAAVSSSGDNSGDEPPPPWLDVTAALQYLVTAGSLELYAGVSKKGLMGFADVTPDGAEKRLYVAFSHGGALMEKEVGDEDLMRLPAAGAPVKDAAAMERLRARLHAAQAAAAASGSGGGGSGASSRHGSSAALRQG